MPQYDNGKGSRKLPYPLQDNEYPDYTPSPIGVPSLVTPNFFNPDTPDDKVTIQISVSLNELTAIASAIDVGRDIAYGEQSYDLWRTWCSIFVEQLIMSCEQVADCIETDETTQVAIATAITNNTTIQEVVIQQTGGLGNPNTVNGDRTTIHDRNLPDVLDEPVATLINCDLDALWSGVREMVNRIDDGARDLLEDLANINDVVQRYQAFIDVVPILGDIAEAVVTAATELIPDILNSYNAHSSEEVLDGIACDIFGLVCSECRYPTFMEVLNYYAALGYDMSDMDAMTTLSLVSKLSQMMVGSPPPELIYFSVTTFELFTLFLQATFNGVSGTAALSKWCRLGEDYANNNWIELCDSCNENFIWWEWDFQTQGKGEFYVDTVPTTIDGVFVQGEGWKASDIGSAVSVRICMPLEQSWRIHAAAMQVEHSGFTTNNSSIHLRPTRGSNTGVGTLGLSTGTAGYNRCSQGFSVQKNMQEILFTGTSSPDTSETYIRRVIIVFERGFSKEGGLNSSEIICT